MPYTVQDLLVGVGASTGAPNGGVWLKLAQRGDVVTFGPQWIADAILELSRDYPFEQLERTGPVVQMVNGQYEYPIAFFTISGDTVANLVPSFFMYYNVPLAGVPAYNPGIGLMYKSVDSLELMFSTPGTPAYWSRWNNKIFIAPQPNNTYYSYMRYQVQHPFTTPVALNDPILLPDEWREIIEYAASVRGAGDLRMLDYQQSYRQILFGDPKKPSDVGLIAARVMQMESDTVSNQGMRQIRPMQRRW